MAGFCNGCGRHCPSTALSCGRGRMLFGQDAQGPGAAEHGGHEGCGHHGGHGRRGGHHGPHIGGEQTMDARLAGLLRMCGHTLYHMGGGKNGQLRLLAILSRHGEVSQRELTERLDIQPGSMSEILAKMEQRGLIERTPMESDRRTFSVRITEAGAQELRALREQNDIAAEELFVCLSDGEKETLASLLERLTSSWREERGMGRRGRGCAPRGE